jgi:molybdopterin-guanine dinucleotide biosynthesis protein A
VATHRVFAAEGPAKETNLKTRIPVYILAGGRASRFGSNKARAQYADKTLIEHVAEALAPIAYKVTAVGHWAHEYQDIGIETISDRRGSDGPLGGLHAALLHLSEWRDAPGALLLAPCDTLGLRAAWAATLVAPVLEGHAPAAAYYTDRWEALFAVYGLSMLPWVEQQLRGRDYALQTLLDASNALRVAPPEDWAGVRRVDRPSDLPPAHPSKR